MMSRFSNQVVLVTGAGSGIGRTTARSFAAEGAAVVIADIDGDAARTVAGDLTAEGHTAQACPVDVADRDGVRAMVADVETALGRVDVLVNNAAAATDVPFEKLSEREWEREIGVSLKGPFLCSQAVVPGMARRRRGAIVNIGSVNGHTYLGNDLYSAAKAGLVSLTRTLAVRYGPDGVRANLVAPGTIRTPIWNRRLANDPQVHQRLTRWYPLGRLGEPEDVAAAVLFLASDAAAWITGVALPVDGGLLAGNAPMIDDIFEGQ
jgi:NAD(P)-dependent dehydrogenase (short-subunit alcohol dehydrogenase family)